MRPPTLCAFTLLVLSGGCLGLPGRAKDELKHGKETLTPPLPLPLPGSQPVSAEEHPILQSGTKLRKRATYLNDKTKQFVVDGAQLPDVDFDIGESYAGLLPISDKPDETRKLFFWFVPSEDPAAFDELLVWLNGGPGCSSLSGLLTENGPFLWEDGTYKPTKNTYSWHKLTNVLYVEQPVGVGFSQGKPNITNEEELAEQFKGFYRQFLETFSMKDLTVYLTGESYAGHFVPYIANAFIDADDAEYFHLGGVALTDPLIGDHTLQRQAAVSPFVDYWSNVFHLNQTALDKIHDAHEHCNYKSLLEKYLTFPPPAETAPTPPSLWDPNFNQSCNVFYLSAMAGVDSNPCLSPYNILHTCPWKGSQLGVMNEGDYTPPGAIIYFNRTDVQKAINAPETIWRQCATNVNVFGGEEDNKELRDQSLAPALNGILQKVIDHTENVIIGSGNLDYILPSNGTLLALQNMTWGGMKGFQEYPQNNDFFVPFHQEPNQGRLGASGTVGLWGHERGLTYYTVELAGHALPANAASAGYRVTELLLGRISSLSQERSSGKAT